VRLPLNGVRPGGLSLVALVGGYVYHQAGAVSGLLWPQHSGMRLKPFYVGSGYREDASGVSTEAIRAIAGPEAVEASTSYGAWESPSLTAPITPLVPQPLLVGSAWVVCHIFIGNPAV
jgi:hypothetical protein